MASGNQILDIRESGIVDRLHDGNVVTVEQDVTAIIEACAREGSEANRLRGFKKPEEFRHVAEIPLAAVEIALAQGMDILRDEDALKKWLNNPENKAFRVHQGRV